MQCRRCDAVLPAVEGKIRCTCGEVTFGPARGLGDSIERFVYPVAVVLGLSDCGGCGVRRDTLNDLVPYSGNSDEKDSKPTT